MKLTDEQVEIIDRLDHALCQFLNNAADDCDHPQWIKWVQRDMGALCDAYEACHVSKIMDLRRLKNTD